VRELVEARVLGSEPLGAYRVIRLAAEGVEAPAPGQFAMARDPRGSAYLPRPVGPFRRDGQLALIVDPAHGVGRLAEARSLALLSPLGHGFDLAGARPESTLLVAGGIGITVFPDVPRIIGGRPRLIAGFRTAEQAAAAALVDAETEVVLAPLLVTEPLEAALGAGGVERVLVAGSGAMGRAVAERCLAAGVACQVALEAPMACGFGACYGCAVELDGGYVRLCVEGPVIDGARLVATAVPA
jgi:NAD(P)H-flavin reductase